MKSLIVFLFFSMQLFAQLPAPTAPPIYLNNQLSPHCYSGQVGGQGFDAQKNRFFSDNAYPLQVGDWLTFNTYAAAEYNYLPILALSVSTPPGSCAGHQIPWTVVPGAAVDHDRLYLLDPILIVAIHASYGFAPFIYDQYYYGWQIPSSALGYDLNCQWIRLDSTNSLLYLSNAHSIEVQ